LELAVIVIYLIKTDGLFFVNFFDWNLLFHLQDNGADVQRSRVLPSNWERYEELPEGTDVITSHGADFSTLLQSSSMSLLGICYVF